MRYCFVGKNFCGLPLNHKTFTPPRKIPAIWYMNNHVHSAPQLERKKEKNREERGRITHYKIDNLNGLEKYSLIFGEQPQQHTCTCTCMLTHCSSTYSTHCSNTYSGTCTHCSNTYSGTCTLQQYIQWHMHTAAIHTVVHAHCSNTYSGTCTLQQYTTNTYNYTCTHHSNITYTPRSKYCLNRNSANPCRGCNETMGSHSDVDRASSYTCTRTSRTRHKVSKTSLVCA